MAPILTSLKNFIRHGKKQKSAIHPRTHDSGTGLNSNPGSPIQSVRAHSYTPVSKTSKMTQSSSPTRSASPPCSAAPVAANNEIDRNHNSNSNNTDNKQQDFGYDATIPSVQHFTATAHDHHDPNHIQPQKTHEHRQDQHQQQECQQQHRQHTSVHNASQGHTNKTEAASRMIAEENQQRSKLPVLPGLEHYNLLEKMGDGAFSNVYKAHDLKNDRLVAVKVVRKFDMNTQQSKHLHRDMKKKPRMTERANILKEVQIMRQLKHPGIVELLEFSESEDHYYLVLELAPGGELFHRIVKLTYFSEELTRHVIVQVAQAIRYLHEEKGVVHRDIKPENILFEHIPIIPSPPGFKPDEEDKEDEGIFQPGIGGGGIGRVKIADFGLSKIVWDEQTMTPCGTVGYTAPEIVKDERYSKSVDMWALGCVLYTLLCGFPPFYDESIQALTEKVARGQYTFLSPWWDEISYEVKDLITHLLCVDPNERYTIDQFLAHPWIKAGEQSIPGMVETTIHSSARATAPEIKITVLSSPLSSGAFAGNKLLANVVAMTPEYGAPRTPYKRRAENPLSPGIGLKEVFDVSNAVHRMEEESRRRHTPQAGYGLLPGDNRQRQAFMTQLNEEEEEEDYSMSEYSGSGQSEDEAIAAGMGDVSIQSNNYNHSELQRQQQEYQRAQKRIAAEKHNKYLQKQQQAGETIPYPSSVIPSANIRTGKSVSTNGTASTITSSSMSSSPTNRRRRVGFELNMNQATLLKRRAKNGGAPLQHQTLEQQDQMRRHAPAVAV
ncbi:hypothetical protein FBU30_006697 [Linnemannia zychae]|nr:hypothetical protein FBU30_006697 [Linnemannia zychae]